MNRAVRRQQTKESKGGSRAGARASLPRTGTSRAAPRVGGGGLLSWRPRFLMDVISELRKVVWPTREDTFHMAVVVVIVTIIFGALLGGIDIGFSWLVDKILLN